jgi:hypothetical protein
MQIMSINSVSESGNYIHVMLDIYMPGYLYREVYCKFDKETETSRSFLVMNGSVCQNIQLTYRECDEINDYILHELLTTA